MIPPETIAEFVRRSRAAQGLPMTISDPGTLSRIAAIFASARNDRPKAAAPTLTFTAPSDSTTEGEDRG